MARRSSAMCCGTITWCLLVIISRASAQLQVVSTDTNQAFPDPSNIVVGSASDLALQVKCLSQSSSSVPTWSFGGTSVGQGLSPFGVSQEDGVLRIYPTKTELSLGMNIFQCSDGTDNLMVQFNLAPHLFFTAPVPEQAPPTVDVTSLCSVPDIPAAMVTAVNGTGFSYCQVVTERGTFRSRSIITEQEPTFSIEPSNITVNPVSGTSRAAFACSVYAYKTLQSIEWYYEMVQFGSGMGIGPGPMNGLQTGNESGGISIFSGSSGVDVSKTSILVLDNVGSQHEGLYRCVATFQDGQVITSRNATLMYNMTSSNEETMVLAPPSTVTVLEGNTLLLPCVSSGPSTPSFSRILTESITSESVSNGVSSNGLEIVGITTSDAGVYTCTVGSVSVMTMVTVTFGIIPPATATFFQLGPFAGPPEHIQIVTVEDVAVRIRCDATGVDSVVLNNGEILQTTLGTAIAIISPFGVSDSGFYQCASSRDTLPPDNLYTAETLSAYFFATFVRNTAVLPASVGARRPDGAETILFNCTTEGNPLPRISWSLNGEAISGGVQAVTGFNQTANSTLTVIVDNLNLGTNSITCTATQDAVSPALVSMDRATVSVQSVPVITTPPTNLAVAAPNQAVFTCIAEGFPLPNITWIRMDSDGSETPLSTGGNILISSSSAALLVTSTLTFSMTDLTLTAGYVCVATSGMGSDTATAQLDVNAPPVITVPPVNVSVAAPNQAMFTCTAKSFPVSIITWVRINSDGSETNLISGGNLLISSIPAAQMVNSTLTFSMTDLTLTAGYVCVATNTMGSDNATAQLVVNALPAVLVNPEPEVVAVSGDLLSLNCTAQGNPLPTIGWMVNGTNGSIAVVNEDQVFNVSFSQTMESFTTTSVLTFIANEIDVLRGNRSSFYCVPGPGVESEPAVIIIAGPPLSPAPVNTLASSRCALITWPEPFSLLPITNYFLELSPRLTGNVVFSMNISSQVLEFNVTSLSPNIEYVLEVGAVNRAGMGLVATATFRTLEDVPTGTPQNVGTSSTELNIINVQWSPVPDEQANGIIIGYSIRYRIDSTQSSPQNEMISNVSDILSADVNIVAGETYRISVAARTQVGLGPYSPELIQPTIPVLPVFPTGPLPVTGSPSDSTITITLPTIATADIFSHYWVIVFKLGSTSIENINPKDLFQDNSTFTNYSSDVPLDRPYIVAEISTNNYSQGMTFLLGDEARTRSINDFPDLYRNGPLEPETSYVAFVWGFSASVPDGMRAKRQNAGARQYSVFSSSSFTAPVQTASSGLTGGAVAGVVIAIILFFLLVAAIIIITILLVERAKITKEYGLPQPPSRKGSMRIRDHREIIPAATTLRNLKAEAELVNLSPDDVRLSTSVEELPSYVKSMHANTDHLFSEEYEILSIKSPSLPHIQCSMPFNVAKNRYANINCFDDTRVHLDLIPGIEGSDYINGNYIDDYMDSKSYIATQGPLAQTTHDFWRLVWEQNSCCIIMLTNTVEKNRVKCHQYWPEVGSLNLGEITVTLIEIQQLAYYTIRTFRMSRGNDRREVKQFHYTGWPDFGVPDYPHPVMAFIKRINNFKRTTPGPYIIHCSAGVGRTGTMITIRAMMKMMEEEGKIDVFNFVLELRRQRNYMVQTERQYIFIHDCLLEMIKMGETTIPIQTLRRRHKELLAHNPQEDTSKMEIEYARLKELEMVEVSQFDPAKMSVNVPKNRYQEILPYDRYRVRLLLAPGVTGSDFINASYIDGYQHRHQYIVTQGPMKNTVTDFWRMIWEHRVSCILMLCPLEEKGKEQSVRYWPTEKIIQQGDMFIELTQVTDYASYTMREFSITNTKINESRVIKHYQYSDWMEDTMPTNAAAVIDLIGVIQKTQHMCGGGPIVVHDSSSVGRSATFCILSSVLEQLKVEGIVDLFFCVHSLRHQQPGLINSYELYKFCYQAVIEFLDSFDHYANFN